MTCAHDHTICCKLIKHDAAALLANGNLKPHEDAFIRQLLTKAEESIYPFVPVSLKQLNWWVVISPTCRRAIA
jgi:hypothetical protein